MVNISLIGLGQRGQATLERLALLSNANVLIKCDVETDWQEAASHPDVDLVWVCTPWEWHVRMAVFAMRSGKDVALEKVFPNVSYATGMDCSDKREFKYFEF